MNPRRLSRIRSQVGVNTHLSYTDSAYADISQVTSALAYLGVQHIRDTNPIPDITDPANVDRYDQVGAAGYKLCLCSTSPDVPQLVSTAKQITNVAFLEGFNEINSPPFPGGYAAACDEMAHLRQTAYASLQPIPPIYDMTYFQYVDGVPLPRSIAGQADHGNTHIYPEHGEQPRGWIAHAFDGLYSGAPPCVVTECGYYTLLNDAPWCGVAEGVQACSSLNMIFDAIDSGIQRLYFYELFDEYDSPDMGNHFGLFRYDGTPKKAANAIHNLLTIMRDDNATFTPVACNASVQWFPGNGQTAGQQMLFQHSDGSYYMVLWGEPQIWDTVNRKRITPQPVNATISFGGTRSSVGVYDPVVSPNLVATFGNLASTNVAVVDRPVVVRFA